MRLLIQRLICNNASFYSTIIFCKVWYHTTPFLKFGTDWIAFFNRRWHYGRIRRIQRMHERTTKDNDVIKSRIQTREYQLFCGVVFIFKSFHYLQRFTSLRTLGAAMEDRFNVAMLKSAMQHRVHDTNSHCAANLLLDMIVWQAQESTGIFVRILHARSRTRGHKAESKSSNRSYRRMAKFVERRYASFLANCALATTIIPG